MNNEDLKIFADAFGPTNEPADTLLSKQIQALQAERFTMWQLINISQSQIRALEDQVHAFEPRVRTLEEKEHV